MASPVTVKAFLEGDTGLEELGGPAYLVRLAGAAISSFAARDYAQMIRDLAVRRELIGLGRDIASRAARVDVTSEPKDQIVEAEQQLADGLVQFRGGLDVLGDDVRIAQTSPQHAGVVHRRATGQCPRGVGHGDGRRCLHRRMERVRGEDRIGLAEVVVEEIDDRGKVSLT